MTRINGNTTVEFRGIPECPGYEFGDDGSAWSCYGRGRSTPTGEWNSMSPVLESTGFRRLWVKINGVRKYAFLHDMICWAWHGERKPGFECEFLDGDRSNLHPTNLGWFNRFQELLDSGVSFKEIPECEGYRFCDDGSIWSAWGSGSNSPGDVWRKLELTPHESGHLNLRVKINGKLVSKGAHHMICWAWRGRCPDGLECCHKDGVADHNIPDNLYWGTRQDNIDDQRRHGVFCAFGRYQPPRKTA